METIIHNNAINSYASKNKKPLTFAHTKAKNTTEVVKKNI